MPKKNNDYDNVFKTLKVKHRRLFIAVINDIFHKNYPDDAEIEIMSSDGLLKELDDSRIRELISDSLFRIEDDRYLIECQSYEDGSMAIRIAEYAFVAASNTAELDGGHVTLTLPRFVVIYVKGTVRTPDKTVITFKFPDGRSVDYMADNIVLGNYTREYIIKNKLLPYIPFYVTRYEKNMVSGDNIDEAKDDLVYFRDEMASMYYNELLTSHELCDIMDLTKQIIRHITDGNSNEEGLVNIMGGTVLELPSDRLIAKGREEGRANGKIEGRLEKEIELITSFLSDIDEVPDSLKDKLAQISDEEVLSVLVKKSARVSSVEEFEEELVKLLISK